MPKKRESEEQTITSSDVGTVPTELANGDAEPAKKPPRDKAEAFRRVGNDRIAKAMYAMRRLLPLANRSAYTYTAEQADKVKAVAVGLAEEVVKAFSTIETTEAPPESFL